jgi:hypothetical protein
MKPISTTQLAALLLAPLAALHAASTPPPSLQTHDSTIYRNKLIYVIGDVKQGFIHDKITTREQADNLLKGFHAMKVNGIRIPIFADGLTPNRDLYDYFVRQAISQGFRLFANPAENNGGKRVANGVLGKKEDKGEPVIDNPVKTSNLISRIKQFSAEYKCTWIDPFNEDGKPGKIWSINQINTICKSLKDAMNGAELVGPCTYEITAGINVLVKTDLLKYVAIATTHNLKYEHDLWPKFIAEAGGLPVWDSEANHKNKDGKGSRLIAAIESGVQGIVLYNSYADINPSDGSLNENAKSLQACFLK